MEYETSCGAIVFTRHNNEIMYLIVQSIEGYYGFPKGHIEGIESHEETALREIYEETSIRPNILGGFKEVVEHIIPKKPGVMKRIIYFLAEYDNQEIRFQKEELLDARLMTLEEAINVFQFEDSKKLLKKANDFTKR